MRLVPQGRVLAYPYKGYWSPADTVKERAQLEEMYHHGNCPWMIWDPERSGAATSGGSGGSGRAGPDCRDWKAEPPCSPLHLEHPQGGRCPCWR